MCDTCLAHFYHPARETIQPPRPPDPSFILTEKLRPEQIVFAPRRILESSKHEMRILEGLVRLFAEKVSQLEDKVRQLKDGAVKVEPERYSQVERCELPAEHSCLLLRWYPCEQDVGCKLPAGHIGAHSSNLMAYYKTLYWSLHSCQPACRGHGVMREDGITFKT